MVIKVIKDKEELEIDIMKDIAVQLRMQGYRFMDPFDGLRCQRRIDALHQVRSYLPVDGTEQTLVKEKKRSEQAQLIAKAILKDALAWVKLLDADGN
ncbi:hypothetical protein [Proteiniclasticum ruminis]|uniref:Uncharacterized protein n=1 Tax=Proteiniclasticum ruminis TaxID=398199 RepID=A0A1I4ZKZ7_9CLOT|nr:hypothetical protein [Proteiniclasticum ruminis]SFN50925.1 hypothetical protein SAMN04488695_10239 [Proteiniclasticum ruminis]